MAVRERDRIGGVEKLSEDEFVGGDHAAVGLQAGESSGVTQGSLVTEH